jgi:hypothetical protein
VDFGFARYAADSDTIDMLWDSWLLVSRREEGGGRRRREKKEEGGGRREKRESGKRENERRGRMETEGREGLISSAPEVAQQTGNYGRSVGMCKDKFQRSPCFCAFFILGNSSIFFFFSQMNVSESFSPNFFRKTWV